jgi:hypothetical protein
METAQIIAVLTGIILGTVAIGVACWVWFEKQTFSTGGAILSTIGLVLIGLSIWQSVHVKYGGTELNFEAFIHGVKAANSIDSASFDPTSKTDGYILLTCPASPTGLGVCTALAQFITQNEAKLFDVFSITDDEARKIISKPIRISTSKDLIKDLANIVNPGSNTENTNFIRNPSQIWGGSNGVFNNPGAIFGFDRGEGGKLTVVPGVSIKELQNHGLLGGPNSVLNHLK